MPEPTLAVEGVSYDYSGIRALDDVSITVGLGETVCVVGPNGAGKTTLAHVISGVLRPRSGFVRLNGKAVSHLPAHRVPPSGVAIVLEGRRVFAEQSVRTNLELGAYARRLRRAELEAELDRVFDLFPDLRRIARQTAGRLSGGQQQMLCVGRALMGNASLLVLDEPSMGLSPRIASELYEGLSNLSGTGLSILLIEQNAELAFAFSNRGYAMQYGQVSLEGTVAALRASDLVRQIYLGDPSN